MAEIKDYLLTEEEQKACIELVKKMREKERVFTFNFTGSVKIKAKNLEKADDSFWDWVGDLQDTSLFDWSGVVIDCPLFEKECSEQE